MGLKDTISLIEDGGAEAFQADPAVSSYLFILIALINNNKILSGKQLFIEGIRGSEIGKPFLCTSSVLTLLKQIIKNKYTYSVSGPYFQVFLQKLLKDNL